MTTRFRRLVSTAAALSLASQPLAADTSFYYRNSHAAPGSLAGQPPSTTPDNVGPPVKGTGELAVLAADNARARPGLGFALQATARDASGTVSWASTGSALPPGLGLNGSTGLLTGVPSATGTYAGIVLTGTDGAGRSGSTQPITVTVVPSPTVTMDTAFSVSAGQALTLRPSAANVLGSQSWSLSAPLPAGLSLDARSGAISGSTDQAGTLTGLVLSVTDSDGATGSSSPFTLKVTSALTLAGVGSSYAARVGVPFAGIRPSVGGTQNPVSWTLGTGTLPAGLTLDASTGVVSGTAAAPATASGLTLRATDTVTGASVSSGAFSIAAASTPGIVLTKATTKARVGTALRISPTAYGLAGRGRWFLDGGTLPAGLSLDPDAGTVSGTLSAPGQAAGLSLRVIDLYDGSSASSPPFTLTSVPALSVGATGTLAAETGQAFSSAAPQAAGLVGKPAWSASGPLPAGLAVDTATGMISGMPQAPTASPATLSLSLRDAWDGATAKGPSFTLTVIARGAFAVGGIEPSYLAYVGKAFLLSPRVLGAQGAVSWQASSLPSWASFDPASGTIAGTPSSATSDGAIVLTATDAASQSGTSRPFSITAQPSLAVAYAPGPLSQGAPYSLAPTVTNPHGPVTFALTGNLPAGLALDASTGSISGTTYAAAGAYPLTVTATDGVTSAASNAFALTVPAQPWSASIPAAPSGKPSQGFSVAAVAKGFDGPVTWSLGSGSLPAWASLSGTAGTVTGVPDAAGYFGPLTLVATDGSGHVARTNPFSIVISAAPALSAEVTSAAATVNAPYRLVPTALNSQGAVTWSLASGTLPGWAALDAASGAISGIPDQPGQATGLSLSVTDASGASARTATFAIVASRSALSLDPVPATVSTILGSPLSLKPPAARGASGAVGWSLASGTLPPWASLAADGTISGTPTVAADIGTSPGIALQAVDGSGAVQLTNAFSIRADRAPLSVDGPPAVVAHAGNPVVANLPTARNALGTVAWSISPALPAGLTLDTATGKVSGTPTAPGTTSHALTATDSFDGATGTGVPFAVGIVGDPQVGVPASYTVQINFMASLNPTVTNAVGATTWRLVAGTLPAGLGLDPATGTISGAVSSLGTTSGLRLSVTDSQGAVGTSAPFSIQAVNRIAFGFTPAPQGAPPVARRVTVPYASPAPAVTNAVGSVSYSLVSGTIPPGLALDAATGIVSGTPTQAASGSVTLAVTDSNGSTATSPALDLSIGAAPSVTLSDVNVRVGTPVRDVPAISNAVPDESGNLNVSVLNGLPSWAGLNSDPRTGRDYAIVGKPTAAGSFPGLAMRVVDAQGATGTSAPFGITVTPGLTVSNVAPSYSGRAGLPLSPQVAPSLGRLIGTPSWTAPTLPPGLGLDATAGTVSGKPTAAFGGTVTLTATDTADGATLDVPVTFAIAPAVTVTGTPSLVTHQGIDANSTAPSYAGLRGTAMTWSLASGTLPPWATLDASTGIISARNPSVGTVTGLSLTATDNLDQATGTSAPFSLTVVPPLAVANVSTTYAAQVATPFTTAPPSASNAIGTTTWSVVGGALPSWATLNPQTGVISGTPDSGGSFPSLALRVQDAQTSATSVAFTLSVASRLSVSLASSSTGGRLRVGDTYTLTPTAGGIEGTPSWSMAVTSGTLPGGLSQDPATGVISGTVTSAGEATFTVQVADSTGTGTASSSPVTLTARPALTVSGVPDYGVRTFAALNTQAPQVGGAAGSVSYSLDAAVPTGMNPFDAGNGTLTGVPSAAFGPYSYTLTATDSWDGRSASTRFGVTVRDALSVTGVADVRTRNGVQLAAGPNNLPDANAANAFDATKVTWGVNGAPAGVTFVPGSGLAGTVSGYPDGTAFAGLTLQATDTDGSSAASQPFSLVVAGALSASMDATALTGRVGVATSGPAPTPTNAVGAVTWSLVTVSGNAPANVTLAASGKPSFTPDAGSVGTWTYRLRARDAFDGATADTAPVTVTITNPPQPSVAALTVHQSYGTASATPSTANAKGAVSYALQGTVPAWLSVAGGKVVAATPPDAPGSYGPYTLAATDADGLTGTTTFGTTVLAPPAVTGIPASYVVKARVGTQVSQAALPTYSNPIGTVSWRLGGATGQSGGTALSGCATTAASRGLSVDPLTGRLSGTPTVASGGGNIGGDACYLVEGVDAADSAAAAYKVTVQSAAALAVSGIDQAVSTTQNIPSTWSVSGTGVVGNPSIQVTGLPAGLSATTNAGTATISGTPTGFGTSVATITLSDDWDGKSLSYQVTFTVAKAVYARLDSGKASSGMTVTGNSTSTTATNAPATAWRSVMADIPAAARKTYMEFTTSANDGLFGFSPTLPTSAQANMTTVTGGVGFYSLDGGVYSTTNPYPNGTKYGAFSGRRIMIAWDGVSRFWVGIDGTWKNGNPAAGTGGFAYSPGVTVYPTISMYNGGAVSTMFTDPSTFAYPMPAGFIPAQQ